MRAAARKWQASGQLQVLVVYIEEAHASDEWPVGALTSVCAQPKSLAERCELARHTAAALFGGEATDAASASGGGERDAGVPSVVVDTMENNFADLLGAWPLRFFVLGGDSGGELLFKAEPTVGAGRGYDLEDVDKWLARELRE